MCGVCWPAAGIAHTLPWLFHRFEKLQVLVESPGWQESSIISAGTRVFYSVFMDLKQTNKQINQDFIGGKFTIFLPDHCKKVSFFEGPQAVLYSLPSPHLLFSADPETAGIGVFHQVLVLVFTHAGNSVARASSGGQSWETNNAPALHGSRGCFHAAMIPQDHAIVWVGRDLVNHPGPTPWLGTPSTRAGF